jgi:hypothetical protein
VAKKASPLLRVHEHERLVSLQAELADFQSQLPAATSRLEDAEHQRRLAEDALALVESRVLAGRASDADLAAAQSGLADAKRSHALALHAHDDVARMLRLLPSAIEMATAQARAEVAATLRARYAAEVAALREALLAADRAHQQVQATFALAQEQFPAPLHPHYHAGVEDLADAGLTTHAARLSNLSLSAFAHDGHNPREVDYLLKDIEQMLAAIPTMAGQDVEARANMDRALVASRQRDLELQRRQLAMHRADLERFGLR